MARFFVGKCFPCYEDLQLELALYEKENFVNVAKKHSRTIENAIKRGSSKSYNSNLMFSEVNFVCKHSCAYRQRANKGIRPNTRTEKVGCPFIMKFRATADGQALTLTHFEESHNHERTQEEFKMNPKQRRVDAETETEIAKMINLNANRKMIQSHFSEKTRKILLMGDIHNIAARAKQPSKTQSITNGELSEVENLVDWIKEDHPNLQTHFMKDENVITGIFFQDPEMKAAFSRFPEVLLVDATHKTNDRGMILYTFLCIDGNGESQVAAVFLVQHETEESLRYMVQYFKQENPAVQRFLMPE